MSSSLFPRRLRSPRRASSRNTNASSSCSAGPARRRAVRQPGEELEQRPCAIDPACASTSTSIDSGSSMRSTNQTDEQPAKASSSVTPKTARERSDSSAAGSVSAVGRRNASSARKSRRSQPFASATASAAGRSAVESRDTARSSRSLGAASNGQTSWTTHGAGHLGRSSSRSSADVLPERARLPRRAVVGSRLADEIEPPGRPGASRRTGSGHATPGRASRAARRRRARGGGRRR